MNATGDQSTVPDWSPSLSVHAADELLRSRLLDPPPRPGLLAGLDRFEILGGIGSGGMGLVFLAQDPNTSERVAIKLLRPQFVGHMLAVERFLTEARHMQNLDHPHILSVLEISDRTDGPYFVLPYVEQGSLARLIPPGKGMNPDEVLPIARQIADAMTFAHRRGITHRDIKPANILVDHQGKARLTDFGLGRTFSNDSIVDVDYGKPEGTPAYMSPVVASGEAEDTRCDIYSFGALLYHMLTGRPPYTGDTSQEIIDQIRAGPPTPIRKFNPRAHTGLAAVAEGAMARDLSNRYAQMSDVLADLQRLENGEQILGPRGQTGVERRRMTVARLLAIFFVGVMLVVILIGTITLLENRPAIDSPTPHHLEAKESLVTMFDQKDRVLWSVSADGEIVDPRLVTLGSDGSRYLVLGVRYGEDTGKVRAYDAKGELAWEWQNAEPSPYGSAAFNQMKIQQVFVHDLWANGDVDVIVVSNDSVWYPAKITILDSHGKVKRTYWHPGHLGGAVAFRPSQGQRLHILAWGLNNDMRAVRRGSSPDHYDSGVFCLDPETMAGEAPPRLGTLSEGTELWYALLMPQQARINGVKLRPPSPSAPEGAPGQTFQVSVSDGIYLYLDEHGRLVHRARADTAAEDAHATFVLVERDLRPARERIVPNRKLPGTTSDSSSSAPGHKTESPRKP